MFFKRAKPDAAGDAAVPLTPHRRALLALAAKYQVPAFDLEVAHFSLAPLELIPREFAEARNVLAVQASSGLIFVAMADPTDEALLDELASICDRRVFSFVCEAEALSRVINKAYGARSMGEEHYSGPNATSGATSAMTSNAVVAPPLGPPAEPISVTPLEESSAHDEPAPNGSQSTLLRFDQPSIDDAEYLDIDDEVSFEPEDAPVASAHGRDDESTSPRISTAAMEAVLEPPPSRDVRVQPPASPARVPPATPSAPQTDDAGMADYLRTLTEASRVQSNEAPSPAAKPEPTQSAAKSLVEAPLPKPEPAPPTKGAAFAKIALASTPAISSGAPRAPSSTHSVAEVPVEKQTGLGKTVLVADDDNSARELVRATLAPLGYRVVEADSGAAALALVEAEAADILVIEGALPGVHGFEVCRRVTKSELHWHVPVLIVSEVYRGWRFAADAKAAFGAGACLAKPLKSDELRATVERLIAGAARKPAANAENENLTPALERAIAAAMQRVRAGDLDGAAAELERRIEGDPRVFRLHYTLALVAGRRGDSFRAIKALEDAIELQPRSFVALKNLAVLYESAGFRRTATDLWERARDAAPDDGTRAEIEGHLLALLLKPVN